MLRTIAKAVAGFLFALFFGLALTVMGVMNMTNAHALQPLVSGVLSQQTSQQSSMLDQAKQACQGQTQLKMSYGGQNFTINCSDVQNATVQDLSGLVATQFAGQASNKTYDCQPLQCLQTLQGNDKIFYLFSSGFGGFLQTVAYAMWILASVAGAGYFFALKNLPERLKGFGVTLVAIGIPYFAMSFITAGILAAILPSQLANIQPQISQMTSKISINFLYAFVAGAVLLTAGMFAGRKGKK